MGGTAARSQVTHFVAHPRVNDRNSREFSLVGTDLALFFLGVQAGCWSRTRLVLLAQMVPVVWAERTSSCFGWGVESVFESHSC